MQVMSCLTIALMCARFAASWASGQNLLDLTPHPILITTPELDQPGPIIRYASTPFLKMSGYSWDELVGSTPRILQGPWTDTRELARMKAALLAKDTFEGEVINYRKTGEAYLQTWAVVPINAENGVTTGWLAVQHDLTAAIQNHVRLDQETSGLTPPS